MTNDKNTWRRRLAAGASVGMICLSIATAGNAGASVPEPSSELAAAMQSLDAAWQASPLAFTKALFVEAPASAYGAYAPRAGSVFKPGEAIIVYAEPVGYDYTENGGEYRIELSVDFEILTTTGQVLAAQNDFARVGTAARDKLREFQTSLSFTFEGLQAGDYVLMARFRDGASDKSGELRLPFTVEAEAQAQ